MCVCKPMKIHISHSTKVLLENRPYTVTERGKIEIKGKGEMKTYFVVNKLDDHGKPIKFQYLEVMEKFKDKIQSAPPVHASPAKGHGFVPITPVEETNSRGSAYMFKWNTSDTPIESDSNRTEHLYQHQD